MSGVKEGDEVEVTYRGVVDTVSNTATASGSTEAFRIAGLWHYPKGRALAEVKVITPALQVGWHRVVAHSTTGENMSNVVARHWGGHQWGSSEASHPTVRAAYRSIEFLGGGDDE